MAQTLLLLEMMTIKIERWRNVDDYVNTNKTFFIADDDKRKDNASVDVISWFFFRARNKNKDELTPKEKLASDKQNELGPDVKLVKSQVNNKRANKTLNPVKKQK